jgi:beta-glucosidase
MNGLSILSGIVILLNGPLALAQDPRDRGGAVDFYSAQAVEARVENVLGQLTVEEKVGLLHGNSKFATAGIPRLGVPPLWLSDGPHGIREEIGQDSWEPVGRSDDFATSMPVAICLAATWNPEVGYQEGVAIGQEAHARGKHVLLAPGLNIQRTPLCGRNFEYLGEDPLLAGRMAVGYLRGVQSQDVAACVKHFAANNQETERMTINVEMDERTLREIYLPAFEAAVQEAKVWAVMGAYNKFRGQYCCQNNYLLNKVLKSEWGFQGLVVSDWNATHDTREAAFNGLDLEMGTDRPKYNDYYLAQPLLEGIKRGDYPISLIDDKVRRNLRVLFTTQTINSRLAGSINTVEHQMTARRVAEEGMVLLKNEGAALPLDIGKLKTLAVIGENAVLRHAHGGESSGIKALYEITPLEGIVKRAGDRVTVTYSKGYGQTNDADCLERSVHAARQADAVILIAGLNHAYDSEGSDRKDLKLPYGQDELIQKVVHANRRTVVVLVSGSPVEMGPWLAQVPAVLEAWYSGMEGGNALARVLFGDVNPSGKLPCTFPEALSDSPAHALGVYPGTNGTVTYAEGLLVGYRWFDGRKIKPLFPFGHGLSYTRFEYSGLKVTPGAISPPSTATVALDVRNAGARAGAEVVQVYVHENHPRLFRPEKELKAFRKVFLRSGEAQKISIPLDARAFAFYDPAKGGWVVEKGTFTILVGGSSRDIKLQGQMDIGQGSVNL